MEFQDILHQRRSYRRFEEKVVERSLVEGLIRAARQAPNSCNLQVTHYLVVDDVTLMDRLSSKVSYKFKYAPCVILVLYDRRYTVERYSVVSSAAMAAENIILQAVEYGLGTCPMAGFSNDTVLREMLNIPETMDILLLIAIGYPTEVPPQSDVWRAPLTSLLSYNTYTGEEPFEHSPILKDHTPKSIAAYRQRIAPVYLDRFRLHTYKDAYYAAAVDFMINRKILPAQGESLLDVMSYDGQALHVLADRNPQSLKDITISDYLPFTLDFLKKRFDCKTISISEDNSFASHGSTFDTATYLFQIEFTPHREALLGSIKGVLNPKGKLLIIWAQQGMRKHFIAYMRVLMRKAQRKEWNIYEGNPFYRVGPRENLSMRSVVMSAQAAGFSLQESGVVLHDRYNDTSVRWALFGVLHEE